ncbi:MAG: 50S ribosomal protein L9 [Dehalococcoidia bacterium]
MKVVFLQDVTNVATAGEVKEVANGYARNFLLPKNLAVVATNVELGKVEQRLQAEARREARLGEESEAVAQVLRETTVTLKVRAGEGERIYGSVTSADIATEIQNSTGHEIDKRKIDLDEPIRELGSHQVSIKLAKNVTASITVVVEQE